MDPADPGGALGLAAVLPVSWWLAAAVLTGGFAWLLVRMPPPGPGTEAVGVLRRWLPAAYLVALVVLLHATPGVIDAHGRFPTAWTHVGFVDHVLESGGVDPGYDARYNWPGGFSFGAFLTDLTGAESSRALVRFAPVVVNLLFLAPMALVVRHVTKDDRLRWTALWLFLLCNWVGQDYLAPQPLALVIYLAVVGVLLRWFRWSDMPAVSSADLLARVRRRYPRLTRDDRLVYGTAPPPPALPFQEFGLVAVLAGLGIVLAFSHQITPFMLVLAAVLLVTVGRVDRPLIPVLLAAAAVGWVALGATSFLASNLADLTGAFGDIGGVVDDNQERIGPGGTRQFVLTVRFVAIGLTGAFAMVGLLRQWRARRTDFGLAALAASPVLLMAANSYGGEILLRVTLFSLPFLAALGAFAFWRESSTGRSVWWSALAFCLAGSVLVPVFVIARYGNEAYERVYTDDIAAWDFVVDQAPSGARVVVPDFAGPWRYRGLMALDYRLYSDEIGGPLEVDALDELIAEGASSDDDVGFLILGTASAQYRQVAEGYPDDWQDELVDDLLVTGRYEVVFTAGETRVLQRSEEAWWL
jgi:hypothetical protein